LKRHSFVERLVMKRYLSVVLLVLLSACATPAQPNLVKVRVRVILVDQELTQKPVPFFVVSLKSGAKAAEVKTGSAASAGAVHGFVAEARRAGRQALFLEYPGIAFGRRAEH
jgi:hypothetical protein